MLPSPRTALSYRFVADVTDKQRALLSAIYELFVEQSNWPKFHIVDHRADASLGMDAGEVLKTLPPGLALYDRHLQPGTNIALTAAGLCATGQARAIADAEAFWALLQFALEVQRSFEPDPDQPDRLPQIESHEVEARVRVNGRLITREVGLRVFAVLRAEGVTSGSSGPSDDGSWSFSVARDFKRFRTVENLAAYIGQRTSERVGAATVTRPVAPDTGPKRLFVSFADRDRTLAVRFTDFLRVGCNLNEEQVFLTARPSELTPGTYFAAAIRDSIQRAVMAVLLLTPAYYESHFCLAELGAVWARDLTVVPLLVPPVEYADLDGVQIGQQAGRMNDPAFLDVLRDLVTQHLGREATTPEWNRQRTEFLNDWDSSLSAGVSKRMNVPYSEFAQLEHERNALAANLETESQEAARRREFAARLKADNDRLRAGGATDVPAPELAAGDEAGTQIAEALEAIERAQKATAELPDIVRMALFRHYSGGRPVTVGGLEDQFDASEAEFQADEGYLAWDPEGGGKLWPRFEKHEVEEAKLALDRVRTVAFDGDSFESTATANTVMKPVLRERFGIDDPQFEVLPTWRQLSFI